MFFQLFLLRKMSEIFCHFPVLYQNNATLSPEVPVIPISGIYLVLLMSYQANIFHIWWTLSVYEELAKGFEPVRNKKKFEIISNSVCVLHQVHCNILLISTISMPFLSPSSTSERLFKWKPFAYVAVVAVRHIIVLHRYQGQKWTSGKN